MKLKVGDRVRFKSKEFFNNFPKDSRQSNCICIEDCWLYNLKIISPMFGKVFIIRRINTGGIITYNLENDASYNYREDMFEPANRFKVTIE